MDQDDPEKRIADLEDQLAEQPRGADLPPVRQGHARPHSGSAPDLAQRRLVAYARPSAKQVYISYFGLGAALFVLIAVIATLGYVFPAWRPILFARWNVVFPLLLFFIGRYLAKRRFFRQIAIFVTSHGLTVDERPDEVFSFSDAELGLWARGADPSNTTVWGTALHLRCGPRRFVLVGEDHQMTPGTRLDAPPTRHVDAVMSASDFDELLTMVGRRSR